MKRNTYIENTELEQAQKAFLDELVLTPKTVRVSVREALGRVNVQAVYAKCSSPGYNAAAMDGIAVRSVDTKAARPGQSVVLERMRDFEWINTGNPIPKDRDAVIMIEEVVTDSPDTVRIHAPAAPWQHIRPIGEDIVETEMILPGRHEIRPVDIGALLAGGIEEVEVFDKPVVGILPTGSEIVEHASEVRVGSILDSNSWMFKGLIEEAGGVAKRLAPVPDDFETIKSALLELAKESDVILIGAGSSAGSKDYTRAAIEDVGRLILHGVAIKPGKPTVLGEIDGTPVIGMPGYPVSAFVSFREFVEPVLSALSGKKIRRHMQKAVLTQDLVSSLKHKEYIRMNLGFLHDTWMATPIKSGAGVSMSLVRADAIGIVPQNTEGMAQGEEIETVLLKPIEEIVDKLIITGSHDVVLDILGDYLPVTSTHVGSMGGILAMAQDQALLAPIHLLDPETGTYNIPYCERYLKEPVALIKGVKRQQGLITPPDNPKKIAGYKDLGTGELVYINRQLGAGTRILLDYRLKEAGIDPESIPGYDNAVTTHMNVAQAVKSGDADTGLGAYSAAAALGLGFVETDSEEYDFLVRQKDLDDPRVVRFIEVLKDPSFQEAVRERGGYDLEGTGEVVLI